MLDRQVRAALDPALSALATRLAAVGVTPNGLTLLGLVLGLASAVAVALTSWWLGLALWLLSRLADGLDGPVARLTGGTELGGYLDLVADFTVYGAFIAGVGIGVPDARVAALAVLVTYYVNGAAFLAYSSAAERRRQRLDDGRSFSFVGGLAEGTETIVVHGLLCLVPAVAPSVSGAAVAIGLWAWAAVVGATAVQRVVFARRALGD